MMPKESAWINGGLRIGEGWHSKSIIGMTATNFTLGRSIIIIEHLSANNYCFLITSLIHLYY